MKDSRYKEIMEGLGMPNSRSLLSALEKVANEVEQEVRTEFRKNNKKLQTGVECEECEEARSCDRIDFCTDYWDDLRL